MLQPAQIAPALKYVSTKYFTRLALLVVIALFASPAFADLDGDGYDYPLDCDDTDPSVYPGAPEICDGKDSDCDSVVPPAEFDADGDGVAVCVGDCDDADSNNYPGNTEVCDWQDNNCDSVVDEGCSVCTVDGAACNDGDACTTGDVCQAGVCVGGGSASCDDGNVCTDDTCDTALGCVHTPNTAACNDGDACTTGDACQAGVCVSGSIVICGGVPPTLDLDADDSRSSGSGYYNNFAYEGIENVGGPLSIVDVDVLIMDSDGNTITSAEIAVNNCKFGDVLTIDQNQLPAPLSITGSGCNLTISGPSTHDAYQTALQSIYISNIYYLEYGGNPPVPPPPEWPPNWMELWDELSDLRLVSINVTDDNSESSNTAVASINLSAEQVVIRGIIYVTVQNALSSVSLSGATVSVSGSYNYINIYEAGDLYILEVGPEGYYTVNASNTGYVPASKDNVNASIGNDAGNPVSIYLCQAADADADVVPDGQINAGDYLAATRIVLGLKTGTPGERCHGDMNGDGELTLPDLIAILQAVLAGP